jgi:hypothetical protein
MPYRLTKPHRRRGTRYQAGDMYRPTKAELRAFPDRFEEIEDGEDTAETEDTEPKEPSPASLETDELPEPEPAGYSVVQRSPGWYDVVGPDGTPENDTALRQGEAEDLHRQLSRRRRG